MKNLVNIHDLKELLGYSDLRSVRAWCKKNNAPLIVLGRNTYTQQYFIDHLVEGKLSCYVNENYDNPESVMDAIRKNKKPLLSKAIQQGDSIPKRKETKRNKNIHSKASIDLINALNSAK